MHLRRETPARTGVPLGIILLVILFPNVAVPIRKSILLEDANVKTRRWTPLDRARYPESLSTIFTVELPSPRCPCNKTALALWQEPTSSCWTGPQPCNVTAAHHDDGTGASSWWLMPLWLCLCHSPGKQNWQQFVLRGSLGRGGISQWEADGTCRAVLASGHTAVTLACLQRTPRLHFLLPRGRSHMLQVSKTQVISAHRSELLWDPTTQFSLAELNWACRTLPGLTSPSVTCSHPLPSPPGTSTKVSL